MKRYQIAIFFQSSPFEGLKAKQGFDALIGISNFLDEDDVLICFQDEGVLNLVNDFQTEKVLLKDHNKSFKMIEFFELNNCYIEQSAFDSYINNSDRLLLKNAKITPLASIQEQLRQAQRILVF